MAEARSEQADELSWQRQENRQMLMRSHAEAEGQKEGYEQGLAGSRCQSSGRLEQPDAAQHRSSCRRHYDEKQNAHGARVWWMWSVMW